MSMSTEYIAGLFDGEGSVGLYHTKRQRGRTFSPSIRIDLRDERHTARLLSDLCARYDVKLVRTARGECSFRLTKGDTILRFIDDVLPFTRLKTTQLVLLQAWLETKTYGHRFAQVIKNHKRRRR
jgi:hypothetical protein